MQDQQFMQSWVDGHNELSAAINRGAGHLRDRFSRRIPRRKGIGNPYGIPAEVESKGSLPPAARASLRGLAASAATVVLWVLVMVLATPTPGFAASIDLPVMAGCVTHLELA